MSYARITLSGLDGFTFCNVFLATVSYKEVVQCSNVFTLSLIEFCCNSSYKSAKLQQFVQLQCFTSVDQFFEVVKDIWLPFLLCSLYLQHEAIVF